MIQYPVIAGPFQFERRVHALEEYRHRRGSVFGWHDPDDGLLTGIVVGHQTCVVIVQNIMPGVME